MGTLALGGSYYSWSKQGRVFSALALVTAPVIYTTAAGTGGPLLWNSSAINGSMAVNIVILSVGIGITTAASAASVLGITGAAGQSAAPGSTTAIDAMANLNVGAGFKSNINVYRVGTVTKAGTFFQPTHTLDTGAITTINALPAWVDIGGAIIVPPGSWASISAAATATAAVCKIGVVWAEIPLD